MRGRRVRMGVLAAVAKGGRYGKGGCSSVHWEITPKRRHYGDTSGGSNVKLGEKGRN